MPLFSCHFECGKTFKTRTGCIKHELSLVCTKAKRRKLNPEPCIVPTPQKQRRARKSTVEESIQLADDFDCSILDKASFCRERNIPVHRLRHAYETRERLTLDPTVDIANLTPKQLQSRSFRSGEVDENNRVIDSTMSQHLLEYVKRFRGPAPPGHMHYALEDRILYQQGERLGVTILDLVNQIALLHDDLEKQDEFDQVPEETWTRRVRDWCRIHKISKRQFTTKTTTREKEQLHQWGSLSFSPSSPLVLDT